ncbi:GNAT superfamily N-acetyltransferase [Bradyrhizobium sp. CIR3A]|nr:GNAT superfamily N-acetyltransferase [Bradyrhizobium sp. CIR3A]
MQVRPADSTEIDHLAQLWHDAWHGSHAHLAPPELVRLRTLASFRDRLAVMLVDICVVGPSGAPLGLCALKSDELYQLFVSPTAHGTGVAAALIADAEARPRVVWSWRGSPARSATCVPPGSTRRAAGATPAPS